MSLEVTLQPSKFRISDLLINADNQFFHPTVVFYVRVKASKTSPIKIIQIITKNPGKIVKKSSQEISHTDSEL